MGKIKRFIKQFEFCYNIYRKLIFYYYKYILNDEAAIKRQYKKRLNRYPDLDNPVLFTDKLQWLKLNWHDPKAKKMADKYLVREIVIKTVGSDYLNTLYGVYNSID